MITFSTSLIIPTSILFLSIYSEANCDDRQNGKGVDNDNTLRRVTALNQIEFNELMSSFPGTRFSKAKQWDAFHTPSGKAVCHAQVNIGKGSKQL